MISDMDLHYAKSEYVRFENFLHYIINTFTGNDKLIENLVKSKMVSESRAKEVIDWHYLSCESVYNEETDLFNLTIKYENNHEHPVNIEYKTVSKLPIPTLHVPWHENSDFTKLFTCSKISNLYMIDTNICNMGKVIIAFDNYENIRRFRNDMEIKQFIKAYKIGIMKFKIYLFPF